MRYLCSCLFAAVLLLTSRAACADDTVRVTVGIPLTGPVAEYGTALLNGFELAKRDLGTQLAGIELDYQDHRFDNRAAVALVNQLPWGRNASLVYMWGYGMCQAASPVAQSRQFPMIAVSGEEGMNKGRDFVLRFSYRTQELAQKLAGYIRSKHYKRIGILEVQIAYMQGILDGLKAELRDGETIEIVDSFKPGDADFRLSIAKLKARQYDVVGALLVTGQVGEYFKQANELQFRADTFGASPFESLSEIRKAAGAMNGAVFPAVDVTEDFRGRYLKTYGNEVQLGWAANAYDFLHLIAANKGSLQGKTGTALLSALAGISSFHGAEGEIRYRDDEHGRRFVFPLVVKKIDGESFVSIPESRSW